MRREWGYPVSQGFSTCAAIGANLGQFAARWSRLELVIYVVCVFIQVTG